MRGFLSLVILLLLGVVATKHHDWVSSKKHILSKKLNEIERRIDDFREEHPEIEDSVRNEVEKLSSKVEKDLSSYTDEVENFAEQFEGKVEKAVKQEKKNHGHKRNEQKANQAHHLKDVEIGVFTPDQIDYTGSRTIEISQSYDNVKEKKLDIPPM
ncbi:UNKNOWN [Stylonychia lemnae]|uniref:Uncharacterized protein n=1 Tax=Stylonychia lemnae TaxID=5949 RepID=A0A077ZNE7_STYLE|nr:UNKNOWN [Stylonychia lemnae]|eukprot:CDW71438.1 UNKNOWN [Stylonychia lemnae]